MRKLIVFGFMATTAAFFIACGGSEESATTQQDPETELMAEDIEEYDPHRGEGKFHDVELGALDKAKADQGRGIYEMKCQSCHKLTDERLVGPGWAGVTKKHKPAWLLNFITNPDPMIDKDPELQAQLELCMVRMPNQNVDDESAFALVEFMRENDGVK